MKKLFTVLSFLLVGGMLFGLGCGTTNQASPSPNAISQYDITGTLQGKIMDAVTGDPIGGSNLKMYLIQGTSNRGPSSLVTDINSPLAGNYAFSGIPVDLNTGEARFRVVVSKPGYQDFEADVELSAAVVPGTNYIVDKTINMIGDIYLYPLGSTAGNFNVYVYDPNGVPIPNASVLLQQNVSNNNQTSIASSDILNATGGLYSSLNATTDATGLATFTGGTLTLGGAYNIVVPSLTFSGVQLQTYISGFYNIGTNAATQTVGMSFAYDLLYAVSVSNSVPGIVTASGVLTIVFNQPVIIDTTLFTAALSGGSGGVLGAPAVTATLSTDGLTLTLTPNITTAPTAKGASITYGYTGGAIRLLNSQLSSGLTLFGTLVNITTGNAVGGTVQLLSF